VRPRLGGAAVSAAVLEVAGRGLSFAATPAHGLLPGDRIDGLRIDLPGQSLTADAVVRSLSEREHPDPPACGVELVRFPRRRDGERWRRFVFERTHPNLIDGTGRAEETWRVLEASRYVELWTPPAARAHVRAAYVRAWQDAHPEVGHTLVLQRQGVSLGVIATSVVYPRSWLLHHLARDGGAEGTSDGPLRAASDLLGGVLHRLQAETDLEHFVLFIERGKRWNERLYVDFAERYFDKDRLFLAEMDVFRRSTAAPLPGDPAAGVAVVAADAAARARLARRLAATAAPIERQALALDEDRLDLSSFTEACARRRYERRREISIAYLGGEARAGLIAESGGEGVNLFGLLNSCRIVPLSDEPLEPTVRAALLGRAVDHYRVAGKTHFLYFEDQPGADDAPARLGFERVSGGLRWIAHRDVIPSWSAYLDGLAPPAPPARRAS
jgi:hypothetical protein